MKTKTVFPLQVNELEIIIKSKFENHSDEDLLFSIYEHKGKKIAVFGISYLMDSTKLESSLLAPLLSRSEAWTSLDVLNEIPLGNGSITNSMNEVFNKIIFGGVFIYIEGEDQIVFYLLYEEEKRSLEKPEIESVVIGPQLSFTESLYTNLNVIRQLIPSTDLVMEKIIVGQVIPREVRLVYMKSVANDADVNTMRQRIQDLDVDEIEDSTALKLIY